MKKKYINNIRRSAMLFILLLVGWIASCPVSAETVVEITPDPSTNLTGTNNGTNIQPLESLSDADYGIKFTFSKGEGSTHPAYYFSNATVRLYRNNTFTVECDKDYTITKIVFNATSNGTATTLISSNGEIVYDASAYIYTWNNTNSEDKGLFSIENASGQLRFTSVVVTLDDSSVIVPKPKAPVFSQGSCDFYEPFELTITDLNEPAATIRYTLDGTTPDAETGTVYTAPITIPTGADVVVNAVAVSETGVSSVKTATYHFVAKHKVSFIIPNKGGLNYFYLSSSSEYGQWSDNTSIYVTEGEQVDIGYYLNSSYECRNITVNGTVVSTGINYYKFTMPNTDLDIVIETAFNPASPSDPQPGDITKKYNLTLVANPTGAASLSGAGEYAAGTDVYVAAYNNLGYVFTGWSRDGETISTTRNFTFTMPSSDVALTANFVYNPSNPKDPEQPTLKHPLTVIASPAGAGSFSISNAEVTFGDTYSVYAYPNIGYRLKGWLVNGVAQAETSTTLRGTMTDAGAQVVGLFVFDPVSPSNPGANYYNPTTGQVIIDDFAQGNLSNAMNNVVGRDNYANVSSLIVKGLLTSNDYYFINSLSNTATIDLSRAGGETALPGYTFNSMSASGILLPSVITSIGDYAFLDCANLTSLTVYAQVPPTCTAYTFASFSNKANCTIYVPASAIELYSNAEYWKEITILPITSDAHILQVNLPEDGSDGRYKNYSLEVVNLSSGVRQKYVISDRLLYTFNGLQKDEQFNVYMYSPSGLEIGRIENVVIPQQDIEVTFEKLKTLYTVSAKVLAANDSNVTSQVTVEWLKPLADGTTTYLRKATSLGEIPDGQELICRVTLNNQLGVAYMAPEDVKFTVGAENNTCTVTLVAFRNIALSGTLVDGDGVALAGATVSATQTLNSKYSKTYNTKTDNKGAWTLSVLDAPQTDITYAASECINVTNTVGAFDATVSTLDLGKTTLKSIVGARITYGFTYHAPGTETVESYYSDYLNVSISVFNITQNRAHGELSLQYPILAVLDENINSGDQLRLTATSKTKAFNPIEQTVTVSDNQRAEVTFDIVGKGGIAASFDMTENPAVIAMLYSSKGELLKKVTYTEAKATFTELADGGYTLVSMGQSDLMNSILRLANFDEIGLTEGKDYVKNTVTVESGKLAEVKNSEIPAFDESLFYYTSTSTSFSSNKSSITTGNYLTLRTAIDFKTVYKTGVSNVALIIDLPEACDFVEKSVIQGPNLLPYTLDNNRLTIQLGSNYTSLVRFCVVPTAGGAFNATGSITFDYNAKSIAQPIGAATAEIKDIEISVPSVIADKTFKVTGSALANSSIKIYENGTILGSGKANAAGTWYVDCELNNPYNLSTHSIYAEIATPAGVTMETGSKSLTYDVNALQVAKVTMYHWNPEMHKTYVSEFDFLNPKTSATQWTVYYPKKVFTYTIEFTANDPDRISNVILYVHTADGKFVPFNATFNKEKGLWYAECNMGNSCDGYYPVNCSVDFDYQAESKLDANHYSENINHYENEATILNEKVGDYDKIVSTLDGLFSDENSDVSSIINSMDEINSLLGLNSSRQDVDYDDAQIEQILATGNELLSDENVSFVNNLFTQDINEINSLLEGILISDCSNLNVDDLLAQGYEEIKKTDGTSIYFLASESSLVIVDFTLNKCYNVSLDSKDPLQASLRASSRDNFLETIHTIRERINNGFDKLRGYVSQLAGLISELEGKLIFKETQLADQILDLDECIIYLKKNPKSSKFLISMLETQYKLLTKEALWVNSALNWFRNNKFIDNLKVGRIGGGAFAVIDIAIVSINMIDDLNAVVSAYNSIPDPCPDDQSNANRLRTSIASMGIGAGTYYLSQIGLDIASIVSAVAGTSAAIPSGGTSLSAVAVSIGLAVANFVAAEVYNANFDRLLQNLRNQVYDLKCIKDKNCGENGMPACPDNNNPNNNNGGGANQSGSTSDNVQIDPSGYVYEAVPTNRIEGVQATIYYKETKHNIYGDPYDEVILWNAEEYAQKNPLFTDDNGMYRWDVPQGLWQVKFEKDGYVTSYSEWLPVPPPQLDVNIAIVQNKQPEVTEARAYEEGIEVQFDKFMNQSTLTTDNIYVTAGGEKLNGEIHLINSALADEYASAEDANATRYTSRIRFVPAQSLGSTTGEIRITVSRNVKSYAGIPMAENFSQVLDVEKEVQTITADDVKVLYGGEKEVTIYALPYEAAVGRTLRIANSSSLIASIDATEATLDAEGKATIKVKGDLPGRSQLSFTIDNVTASGECAVDVVTEIILAEAPKASRASGTAVYRGTKVKLTTVSKDAVIYFTTDGSCPCDENGTRRKYSVPIVINDDTQIIAMTSVGDDEEVSETVQFSYTLKRSDMDFQMAEGWTWVSHSFENAVAPATLAEDEGIARILSQTQEIIRDPQLGMIGTLTKLIANESYKVETTTATARQRLSDFAWNPATPISLNSGWNWLGYPVSQTMTIDEALETTEAQTLDVIVGQSGFAQFNGEKWIGTLETMSPGMGYMYQSQSAKNIVYNTAIISGAAAKSVPSISKNLPLVLDIHKYGTIMPLIATITAQNGESLENSDYQVSAFCGTECRGIGRVVNGLIMMNVYGNLNDKIAFQVISVDGEETFSNNTSLNFSESVIGDLFNPFTITINNRSGIANVKYDGNIKLSIEGEILHINGIAAEDIELVEVYDVNGLKLIHETSVSESGIRISNLSEGVYVVIVNGNGEYTYHKIAFRKI